MQSVTTADKPQNGKSAPLPAAVAHDLALSLIDESPTNPRRTFLKIEELAADIKEHGVLEPVLVRPKGKRFEIVFGARRLRGSKVAGCDTIPAMIRELSDEKAFDLQVAENGQRNDLHPLEEADMFVTAVEKHGKSFDEVAALSGKSVATVRARMKYASLGAEARKLFLEDKLTAATALVVAGVPAKQQASFLKDLFEESRDDAQPSRADAIRVLEHSYRLRLDQAPFDRADTALVVGTPACGSCPKRTGAQADLFGGTRGDVCLDASCFKDKCDAAWKKRVAAKAENERVMPATEAKKVLAHGRLDYDSRYVDLSETHYGSNGNSGKKYADLLGKKRADVEIVLARDEDGVMRELVAKKEFAAAVPQAGIRVPGSTGASSGNVGAKDWDKKQREREKKEKAEAAERLAAIKVIVDAAAKTPPTEGFWRVLLRALVRSISASKEIEQAFVDVLGLKLPRGVGLYEQRAKTQAIASITRLKADRARALIVMRVVGDDLSDSDGETLSDFRELYGIKPPPAPKAEEKKAAAKTTPKAKKQGATKSKKTKSKR